MNNAHAEDFEGGGNTVPSLYYRVDYSGIPAPTTIGVIRQYNDMQAYQGVTVFTVQNSGGNIISAVRANINPETQGGEGSPAPGSGRADGPVTSQRSRGGAGASGYGGGANRRTRYCSGLRDHGTHTAYVPRPVTDAAT